MASPEHPYSKEGQEELAQRQSRMQVALGVTGVAIVALLVWQLRVSISSPISPEGYQALNGESQLQRALDDLGASGQQAGDALQEIADRVEDGIDQAQATEAVMAELKGRIEAEAEAEASAEAGTESDPDAEAAGGVEEGEPTETNSVEEETETTQE